MACVSTDLMSSYNLYSAILALKLLLLAALSTFQPCLPEKVIRASVSDLKHLTPFWVIAALYLATGPNPTTALNLLRLFVLARIVIAASYMVRVPKKVTDGAAVVSLGVTGYMGGAVIYYYRNSL